MVEADNGHITNFLGYSYVQAEQLDKAKSTFEDYMTNNPDRYNSYDSMAEFYLNQKEYEKAKDYYQKALNYLSRSKFSSSKAKVY